MISVKLLSVCFTHVNATIKRFDSCSCKAKIHVCPSEDDQGGGMIRFVIQTEYSCISVFFSYSVSLLFSCVARLFLFLIPYRSVSPLPSYFSWHFSFIFHAMHASAGGFAHKLFCWLNICSFMVYSFPPSYFPSISSCSIFTPTLRSLQRLNFIPPLFSPSLPPSLPFLFGYLPYNSSVSLKLDDVSGYQHPTTGQNWPCSRNQQST